MTPQQKSLVQETWRRVVPIAEQAATLFYNRLFEINPGLRPLFAGVDMAAQRQKLLQALAAVVGELERIDEVLPQLEELGRRHAGYGVTEQHYEDVGSALLWTLGKSLGEDWTAETKAAWTAAYTLLADAMQAPIRDNSARQCARLSA